MNITPASDNRCRDKAILLSLYQNIKNNERMGHKSGFVNIIGNPNVGKSTLMNAMVGEKLSIITSKMQTTRHRIKGIVNGEDFQIIYSDTPGILKPNYKLQESMMKFVSTALVDADIILYVTDVVEDFEKNIEYIEKIRQNDIPILVLLNKIDLSNQEEVESKMTRWRELLPNAEVFPISATENFNIDVVFNRILHYCRKVLPSSRKMN